MQRRKPSRLTKYILLAIVVLAVVTITALQNQLRAQRQQTQLLQAEVDAMEQSNLELEDRISQLGTDEAVIRLARERLHWVMDGESVYIDDGE